MIGLPVNWADDWLTQGSYTTWPTNKNWLLTDLLSKDGKQITKVSPDLSI